jgi:hypothetical protein
MLAFFFHLSLHLTTYLVHKTEVLSDGGSPRGQINVSLGGDYPYLHILWHLQLQKFVASESLMSDSKMKGSGGG